MSETTNISVTSFSGSDVTTSDTTTNEGEIDLALIDLQMEFFNLIQTCEVLSVKELLDKHSDFDLNCKNYKGMTGLNLAIENDCEQLFELLLSRIGLEIGDSLMHAIRDNRYSMTITLLDLLQSKNPDHVEKGYEDSTEFPQYLTPIMLAAQCGHFKIISLLLKRGHKIQAPHKPRCLCKEVGLICFCSKLYLI